MSTNVITPVKYNIATNEGDRVSVLVFLGGETFTATSEHPRFNDICEYLIAGVDDIERLTGMFDVAKPISKNFKLLSERVAVANGRIYFDLEPIHDILTDTIVRFYASGSDDFKPLVAFLEKIALNPQQHSRDNLFRWLTKCSFGLAEDGDIIAYKGVNRAGREVDQEVYKSSNSGTAYVNGVQHQGTIPNVPGTVVEMPRNEVQHDPRVACHTGLHAGTWGYASGFAELTIRVKINPRDVVSVPTDSGDAKMRVCRYKVLGKVTAEDKKLLFTEDAMRTLVVRATDSIAAPPKKVAAKKVAAGAKKVAEKPTVKTKGVSGKTVTQPKFYEDFKKADFEKQPLADLKWLINEWEVVSVPLNKGKAVIAEALAKRAKVRTKARQVALDAHKRNGPKQTKIK